MRRLALVAAALLATLALAASGQAHHLKGQGSQGWIRYWGNGTVHLSGRGTLTLKNLSNLQVEMKGEWKSERKIADGAVYTGFSGSVTAVGLGAHVEIRGWDLAIEAKGQGKAWFQGMGSVSLDGGAEQPWPVEQTAHAWLKLRFRR